MKSGAMRLTAGTLLAALSLAGTGPMAAAGCDRRAEGESRAAEAAAARPTFPFAEDGILAETHAAYRLASLLPIVLPLLTAPLGEEPYASSPAWARASHAGVERGLLCAAVAGVVAIGSLLIAPAHPAAGAEGAAATPDPDATYCATGGGRT